MYYANTGSAKVNLLLFCSMKKVNYYVNAACIMSTLLIFVLLMSLSFINVVDHHDVVVVCIVDVVDIVVGKRDEKSER